MTATITWAHIGDLHADEADGWQGIERLERIVADLRKLGDGIDFVFLPGDNANHATPEQYRRIMATLAPLSLPVFVIPGDHDFEDGTLQAYRAGIPEDMRPFDRIIADHRCLFLDIVSAGSGGPDFRIPAGQHRRLRDALAEADDAGMTSLVFMHAFPSDLTEGGTALATAFADARVAFVDTGHTHYNELLNDGEVVYGATRSTAQIEEDGGAPGYSLVSVHDTVPSWTFRTLAEADRAAPHVQILSPADVRLATRKGDVRHIPAPGSVNVIARVLGNEAPSPVLHIEDRQIAMQPVPDVPATWQADVAVEKPGLHTLSVRSGDAVDTIEMLVRGLGKDRPKSARRTAPGDAVHAIGAWTSRGINGARLGPNANGCGW
ncbi:metallophosphoesterase family protein [Sphingomonas sp. Leaf21]|uniref:metallophosphoesterase family protein n=1 Tax=Sphingomonas sp. Leaf21 TaxID=2876550 RepID=UPI001E59CB34|nr:metallophosphoesterase [Sphingomonas sp. Leaf21]